MEEKIILSKHRNCSKHPLELLTRRKIFVCVHCECIYADDPVSQCDCLEGTGHDFVDGTAFYALPVVK